MCCSAERKIASANKRHSVLCAHSSSADSPGVQQLTFAAGMPIHPMLNMLARRVSFISGCCVTSFIADACSSNSKHIVCQEFAWLSSLPHTNILVAAAALPEDPAAGDTAVEAGCGHGVPKGGSSSTACQVPGGSAVSQCSSCAGSTKVTVRAAAAGEICTVIIPVPNTAGDDAAYCVLTLLEHVQGCSQHSNL